MNDNLAGAFHVTKSRFAAEEVVDVSVIVLTYNHAQFLPLALTSIAQSARGISAEIIIYNDASPDDSDEIIHKFIDQNKGVPITYVRSKSRRYGIAKDAFVYNGIFDFVRGDYIAYCDGDDLWADEKLALQLNFMKNHPEVSMTFGPAHLIDERGVSLGQRNKLRFARNKRYSLRDFILSGGGLFPTSNIMIRADTLLPLPRWFDRYFTGDYPLGLLAAIAGEVIYCPFVVSSYRVLESSMSHTPKLYSRRNKARRALIIFRKNKGFFDEVRMHGVLTHNEFRMGFSREIYRLLSRLLQAGFAKAAIARCWSNRADLRPADVARFFLKLCLAYGPLLNPRISRR